MNAPAEHALRILDGITQSLKAKGDILRFSDLVRMLDAQELSTDLIAAIAILVQSEYAVFRAGGEFVDDYGARLKLSPEDFQRVLDLSTVLHPLSKHEVSDASEKVVPFFELDTEIFGVAKS